MIETSKNRNYYGRRGNEVIKIEERGETINIKVVLIDGWDSDLYKYQSISLLAGDVKIQMDERQLTLWADKSECGIKMIGKTNERWGLLWPDPEGHFNEEDEESRWELEGYKDVKSILEEFEKTPVEQLWDMDITVVGEFPAGKFNCMASMETGWESKPVVMVRDASKHANPIRRLNAKYYLPINNPNALEIDLDAKREEYLKTIKDLLKKGVAGDIDVNDIKFGMQIALDLRKTCEDGCEEEREALINATRELIAKRETPQEEREIWIRGLCVSIEDFEVKEYVKQLSIKEFNRYYLPAMENEADESPSSKLMSWYKEGLGRNINYRQECKMYNRLAYFYLWSYKQQSHKDQARAYFMAMERRGIEFSNPYQDYYNKNRHTELINVLLDGRHEDDLELYMEEYYRKLKGWLGKEDKL